MYFYKHLDLSNRNEVNPALGVSCETKLLTAGHSAKLSSLAYKDRSLSRFLFLYFFIYLADGVLRCRCQLLVEERSNTGHTNTKLACLLKFIHLSALKSSFYRNTFFVCRHEFEKLCVSTTCSETVCPISSWFT